MGIWGLSETKRDHKSVSKELDDLFNDLLTSLRFKEMK
jgi:hypothetical protein